MKNIYIRGSELFPESVIKTLLGMDGINYENLTGDLEDYIYFVDPVTKFISSENINSLLGQLILGSNEWEEMVISSSSREDLRDKLLEKYPIKYTGSDKISYNEGYDDGFEIGYRTGWEDADKHSIINTFVSPKEKLPEDGRLCAFYVYGDELELCIGDYNEVTNEFCNCLNFGEFFYRKEDVISWAPIPIPPVVGD